MSVREPSVRLNLPLQTLYIVGAFLVVVGVIVIVCASLGAKDFVSLEDIPALAGEFVGFVAGWGIVSFGALVLLGAAVAHAINWQLVNRELGPAAEAYREYQAERRGGAPVGE